MFYNINNLNYNDLRATLVAFPDFLSTSEHSIYMDEYQY